MKTPARTPQADTVALAPVPIVELEVVRCQSCRLVQYRGGKSRCRRCLQPLADDSIPDASTSTAPGTAPERHIGATIRQWRRINGFTQKHLAVKSQLPRTYISRIENGRLVPGLVSLERIAGALNISLPTLLSERPSREVADPKSWRPLGDQQGTAWQDAPGLRVLCRAFSGL
jgi:transcriptional regulator with XRE-family HTH domain